MTRTNIKDPDVLKALETLVTEFENAEAQKQEDDEELVKLEEKVEELEDQVTALEEEKEALEEKVTELEEALAESYLTSEA